MDNKLRNWQDFNWTKHSLQRISENRWRLNEVFESFEYASIREKNTTDILREFTKHGGIKALKSVVIQSNTRGFIIQNKTVVTVYPVKNRFDWGKATYMAVRNENGNVVMKVINESH